MRQTLSQGFSTKKKKDFINKSYSVFAGSIFRFPPTRWNPVYFSVSRFEETIDIKRQRVRVHPYRVPEVGGQMRVKGRGREGREPVKN